MGANSGSYTKDPLLTALDEQKRFIHALILKAGNFVDADFNASYQSLFTQMRRLQKIFFGNGVPAGNTGFLIEGTGIANDVTVKGGGGTGDNAGRLWLEGIPCSLFADGAYSNSGSNEDEKSIHPRITTLDALILTDSAAKWVPGELVGRVLVPSITNGTTFIIAANTATTITITTGNMLAVAAVGSHYRINMRTPTGGPRTDEVWLNVYLDEEDTLDDPALKHSLPPLGDIDGAFQAKVIQTLFVQESVAVRADYVDSDGRQHYMLKIAEISRTVAVDNIAPADVQDFRPQINTLSGSVDALPFTCTAAEAVGDWVYVSGAGAASRGLATALATARAIGYIVSKPTATTCLVSRTGRAPGAGLTPGALVFLSKTTPGGTQSPSPPSLPGEVVVPLGIADSATTFVVNLGLVEEI